MSVITLNIITCDNIFFSVIINQVGKVKKSHEFTPGKQQAFIMGKTNIIFELFLFEELSAMRDNFILHIYRIFLHIVQ